MATRVSDGLSKPVTLVACTKICHELVDLVFSELDREREQHAPHFVLVDRHGHVSAKIAQVRHCLFTRQGEPAHRRFQTLTCLVL